VTERPSGGRFVLVSAALLALVPASLAGHAAAAEPPPSVVRDCASRAETTRPLRFGETTGAVRIGPLELRGVRDWRTRKSVLQTRRDGVYRVKILAVVAAGARVTLAIAPRSRSIAALDYVQDEDPAQAVMFIGCSRTVRSRIRAGFVGPVTSFPGEFVLQRPACVAIEVWTTKRPEPLLGKLALGRSCS
jgi:hypothetical protein